MTEHQTGNFHLERETSGLQLHSSGERGGVRLSDDDLRRRLRQGKRLLLARACAAGPGVTVLDATAGFGLDGLTLSALGCSVTLCERHPMVYALLEDGALRLGSGALARGDIKLLQALLYRFGYLKSGHYEPGDVCPCTQTAVRRFQRFHGLTVDGVCGSKTKNSLMEPRCGLPDELEYSPGGLAVLWAEENTRDALFAAMRQR